MIKEILFYLKDDHIWFHPIKKLKEKHLLLQYELLSVCFTLQRWHNQSSHIYHEIHKDWEHLEYLELNHSIPSILSHPITTFMFLYFLLSSFLRRGAPFLNSYVCLSVCLSVTLLLFVWENLTSVSERYIFTNIF